jgi:hypothetical protein
MGVGLILLLMSENRKSAIEGSRHQHSANPIRVHERVRLGTDAAVSEGEVYSESEEWKRLIENDSELAKVQGILERYGRQYAEQLAEAYRVFNERALLPAIVDMIITSAKLRVERTAPVEILPSDESNGGCALNDDVTKDLHQTEVISEQEQSAARQGDHFKVVALTPESAVLQAQDDALKQLYEAIHERSNRNGPR